MPRQVVQRPNSYAASYDPIEILTISAGVLFIVLISLVY
jgi:hypothetical protein